MCKQQTLKHALFLSIYLSVCLYVFSLIIMFIGIMNPIIFYLSLNICDPIYWPLIIR